MAKARIEVSPEMLAFVGAGTVAFDWPATWLTMVFEDAEGAGWRLRIAEHSRLDPLANAPLILVVDPQACRRLFDFVPDDGEQWHLPSDLRAIALAILDCGLAEPARSTLRLAKSIELLCSTMSRIVVGDLVPAGDGVLSQGDAARIVAARHLIDERWREKLSLDAIARACGINRAKLTRGFRQLFDCSVADALAENRLGGARRMLRETDLPVSSIGYACGYKSNASFARAFARRYGMPPSRLRQSALAA